LIGNVDEGIHVVDCQGISILYNRQAGLHDGLEPEEVIGRHLLQVFPSLNEHTSTLLMVLDIGQPILNKEQTFTNYKGNRVTTINSTWPIHDQDRLVGAVEISKDMTRVRELSEQVVDLQAELLRKRRRRAAARSEARYTIENLLSQDPEFETIKEMALRAAQGSSPVMVYGETGTGKELLVHAIHHASPRRTRPLVAQNCAALPEGLLEAILFGTARGSFTGAEDRPGLFELADGGTLYLDEINSMDMNLQAKLLRVLQDGRVRRVGEATERAVDVRVIVSTNEDPLEAVKERRIRQDLYYRINVVSLELPPLRERRADIPLLSQFFLRKHESRQTLHPLVQRFFAAHTWPGNVRELEHAIEAGVQIARGAELRLADLPPHLQRAAAAMGLAEPATPDQSMPVEPAQDAEATPRIDPRALRGSLVAAERQAVAAALEESGWNLARAARLLGMPRQTLQYRVQLLGLKRPKREE
jgi:arginine utilization regulatory protein